MLESQIQTEEKLATLNEEDRANAIQINIILKKKLGYMNAAVDAQDELNDKLKEGTDLVDKMKDGWAKMKTPAGAILFLVTAIQKILTMGLESTRNIN